MIFAIDPGINGCGVAILHDRVLLRADYVRNTLKADADDLERCVAMGKAAAAWFAHQRRGWPMVAGPDEFVCEWPRVYKIGKGKKGADPNDLLLLAAVDAACALALGLNCRKVEPREWKGNLDEAEDGIYLVADRLAGEGGELSIVERARVNLPTAESLQHNVWDACGVALHFAGRSLVSDRRRVIAR